MTTHKEALMLALEAYLCREMPAGTIIGDPKWWVPKIANAIKEALAQPEQEPVAMKFKIYKPTVPDPVRQGINNALLPWVYDQDRSSGFDASMWVTPVATLTPQRKPLTDEQLDKAGMKLAECMDYPWEHMPEEGKQNMRDHAKAIIEAAHGIKE